MLIGLNLFSSLIAPFILLGIWLLCLVRLKSPLLTIVTLIMSLFVMFTNDGTVWVFFRNPYIMLMILLTVIFNIVVLPYTNDTDQSYLISANLTLLLMIALLHIWRLFLRQSSLYFTEQSTFMANSATLVITSLTLILPILWFLTRSQHPNGIRNSIILLVACISLSLFLGWMLI